MLTIFSWGYWGWGNTAEHLIRAVDATERARGFKPPVFWDIRIRRNVRAHAFSGDAFERLLPQGRYRWFPRLGNAQIANHGSGIRIADPSAARILLEEALANAEDNRRTIFFCACEFPRGCHRATVANLLLKEAIRMGDKVQVVEWPGGEPAHLNLRVSRDAFDAVWYGGMSLALGERPTNSRLCLPWGSLVDVHSGGNQFQMITGPARYRREWVLPIHEWHSERNLENSAEEFRKEHRLLPRVSAVSNVHKAAAPKALTVRNPWAYSIVRLGKDVENRSWRTNYRGPVLIHASAKPEPAPRQLLAEIVSAPPAKATLEDTPNGAIIGVADLFDCVDNSTSKWAQKGQWHWLLRNARPIKRVPCTGKLGLWTPSVAILKKLPAWVRKK